MFRRLSSGQTFIEYTLLIGILITVLLAMTPMIRRGIQAMVKVMSDKVGVQQNAEQIGGRYGQLVNSRTYTETKQDDVIGERLGAVTKDYTDDEVYSETTAYLNQGFLPVQ
jgi:hypothetical protein